MKKNIIEQLRSAMYDSGRHTIETVASFVGNNKNLFAIFYEMSFNEPYPICMRAARVCQLCSEKNHEMILPFLNELPEKIAMSEIDGVKRSYLKIYAHVLPPVMFENIDKLTQLCFHYISDSNESVAVRAYCMDVALKLCSIEPSFIHELLEIANFEINSPSKGIKAKSNQIIRKLNKIINGA